MSSTVRVLVMFNKFKVNIKEEEYSLKMETVGNYIYMYIIGNTTYTCKKLFSLNFSNQVHPLHFYQKTFVLQELFGAVILFLPE